MSTNIVLLKHAIKQTIGLCPVSQDAELDQGLAMVSRIEQEVKQLQRFLISFFRSLVVDSGSARRQITEKLMSLDSLCGATSPLAALMKVTHNSIDAGTAALSQSFSELESTVSSWLTSIQSVQKLEKDFRAAKLSFDHYSAKVSGISEQQQHSGKGASAKFVGFVEKNPAAALEDKAMRNSEKLHHAEIAYFYTRDALVGKIVFLLQECFSQLRFIVASLLQFELSFYRCGISKLESLSSTLTESLVSLNESKQANVSLQACVAYAKEMRQSFQPIDWYHEVKPVLSPQPPPIPARSTIPNSKGKGKI
jgi:hypothetical protein